jgi:antitoxin component YwqK of YwqJK toxin-antitoxin module
VIALAPVLALALGAAPLACPTGTERRGAAPTDGYEEWCEGKDPYGRPRRHGPARTWYDDGALWTEETFREGDRDGPFVEYHRNGGKAREGTFARGRKTGRWAIFRESGQVEEVSGFRDGVADGPFTAYWPGGAVRTLGRHCGGAQCGRWRTFGEDGRELGSVEYGEQSSTP